MQPAGDQYRALYHILVQETDKALAELELGENGKAQERLQSALLKCEELYLHYTEDTP